MISCAKGSIKLTGKIGGENHPFVDDYRFIKQFEEDGFVARQTIPAPAQFLTELFRWDNTENTRAYYPDDEELIKSWFEEELQNRIHFRLFERNNMYNAVSSTKIRQAFLDNNAEYIKSSCPMAVINRYDEIKEIIEKVNNNPKDDYSM